MVLIIGILAAVSLPQYEIAVLKSRMNTALPAMRAIKEANERYYLANGTYTDDLRELDVQVPSDGSYSAPHSGHVCISNGVCMDNLGAISDIHHAYISGGIGNYWKGEETCWLRIYYDHSINPGLIQCGVYNTHPKCAQICKSMGY